MHIYRITNQITNKVYIGLDSSTTDKRWQEHQRHHRDEENSKVLYRAMRKYGIVHFQYEVLEICIDRAELQERERFWIAEHRSTQKEFGYNCTTGGDGGNTFGSLGSDKREQLLTALAATGKAARIKTWVVESPQGISHSISNLREFCREKEIDVRMLWSVSIGRQNHHKGWKCWAVKNGKIIEPKRVPKHKTTSKWTIIGPDATVHHVENLKQFCSEHELIYKQMHKVTSGLRDHHRGFKLKDKSFG